jgi:hypothetical protein
VTRGANQQERTSGDDSREDENQKDQWKEELHTHLMSSGKGYSCTGRQ